MSARASISTTRYGWNLVDADGSEPGTAEPLKEIVDLVRSDWTMPVQLDVQNSQTSRLLTRHRISTLLPTRFVAPDQREFQRDRLATIYGAQMRVESVAAQVLQLLGEAGIATRVLKGLASGELDYPSRSYRQTGDVDLAIRPDDLVAAVAELQRNGFRTHQTHNSPWLLKGTTLDSPNGVEVDLHTRLFQRSPEGALVFEDAGEQLQDLASAALRPEHRLVHAAGHFILAPPGGRRLSGLVDVTRLMDRPSLDLDLARSFAAKNNVEALVGAALHLEAFLCDRPGGFDKLQEWSSPGWLDRKTRVTGERRLVLDHFNRFREVPSRHWARYLPTWLLPDQRQRHLLKRSVERGVATIRSKGKT